MTPEEAVPEAELVRRARGGDDRAFTALCERHRARLEARVLRFVAGGLRRKVSAADVLQETYLVAHRRLADFEDRGEGTFAAWLGQIAEWKAHEAVRRFAGTAKRGAAKELSRGARRDTAEVPGAVPSPSEAAVGRERAEAVRRAMSALSDDHRHVLTLVQADHLTLAQAAVLLGRSHDATKKLYARALARLAELLHVDRGGRPLGE